MAGRLPCQPRVMRAWRYAANTSQVISAQVSLGSQLQYEPQASFAQTPPAIIPMVRRGNPNPMMR